MRVNASMIKPFQRTAAIALSTVILALLAGCGQTGPLYPPDDSQSQKSYDPQKAYEGSKQGAAEADADSAENPPAAAQTTSGEL